MTKAKAIKQANIEKTESWGSIAKSIGFAFLLAIIFRSFFFEPFTIPSGSMKPNLLIGDYIFVSKYSYGYSKYSLPFAPDIMSDRIFFTEPKRGDVVVFRLPHLHNQNYVKRLVGLPGDRVQVKGGIVYVNDKMFERFETESFVDPQGKRKILAFKEVNSEGLAYTVLDQDLGNGPLDNTAVYIVPTDHYFFMGDNRDNSSDSRILTQMGFVPKENLLGRAEFVFFSADAKWWQVWTWVSSLKIDRFFTAI